MASAAAILLVVVVLYLFLREKPASAEFEQLGPILEQFSAPGMEHADPAQCIECHREANDKWENSHHALANAPLTEADRARLKANAGDLLQERQMHWHAHPDTMVLQEAGLPDQPVVGTIGITPLIQYLHLAPDGRIQTHDVAWDVEKEEWFSVFELEDVGEEPRVPGEWGHWTGQGMNWDANCAYCHMTEYYKNFSPETNSYDRKWNHMAITCAQCHPGSETHLEQIRNGNDQYKEVFTPRQVMEACATCHARRDQLTPDGFVPGDVFEDHFHLTLGDVEGIYHPDGQVIGENYVYGSLTMSKMGHAGVTCMDCHDPHTAEFILPVENNALCQRCHGSGLNDAPKIDPIAHSHHPGDSVGNRCVECHMPSTPFMGRDPRRDHSFSIPDPRLNMELGIPDACSKCHNTQSVEWNLQHAEDWYGPDMNADRRAKARLMQDLWDGKQGSLARLKEAVRKEPNRWWKATFINMFQYTPADQEVFEILTEALRDEESMVRSAAIRLLGTSNVTAEQKEALLTDPIRGVRISTALTVPGMRDLPPDVEAELLAYMRHTADSPMGSLRLASFYADKGDLEKSRFLARQAVEFEPLNAEAYRLAAIQLHASGDAQGALDMLDRALRLSDNSPLVHFNLGLLQAELGDLDKAIYHLNQTILGNPQFEDAWYNLIVLYWQIEQLPTARAKLTEALQALPQSRRLRQLARQMPPEVN
ncbi:MAG: tetratricopeptide repeat protein [Puniceicoccaceae bacterium]